MLPIKVDGLDAINRRMSTAVEGRVRNYLRRTP
jgi:hypothetical protein